MKGRRSQRGQSLVEFALILPILLIILLGLLDLGRLWYAYVAVTDAAAEGATYAALDPSDMTQIYQRAQDASGGLVEIDPHAVCVVCSANPTDCSPNPADCPAGTCPANPTSGQPVTVTVVYTFPLATPLLHAIVPEGHLLLCARANEVILSGQLP